MRKVFAICRQGADLSGTGSLRLPGDNRQGEGVDLFRQLW